MLSTKSPQLPPNGTLSNSTSHLSSPPITQPRQLPSNSSSSSRNTSISSSPESRPLDLRSPIPEEDEDETSSETVIEPVTPTDTPTPHNFQNTSLDSIQPDAPQPADEHLGKPPILVSTGATPPSGQASSRDTGTPVIDQSPPPTPVRSSTQTRPGSSRDAGSKRGAFSQFFRRSNSHSIKTNPSDNSASSGSFNNNGSSGDPPAPQARRASSHHMSSHTSPITTRSNSPPSPASPTSVIAQPAGSLEEPAFGQFLSSKDKSRSSTGLSLRDRFITFTPSSRNKDPRPRATSVDLEYPDSKSPELTRHPWGFPAEAGTGLKARRISLSLPDDFNVDVVDLHEEFADQSKILGRRGKTLGKGATSRVTLMTKKGGSNELYAVKEFRGKQAHEKDEDYEKKVKSEYSIAKSLHHPNIVETIRLCLHQGRWNHVMEYCQEGDLFNLVQKGYLTKEDRLSDRLCLFKQLVQGVHYLHEHGIAHRDIKLENLLITGQSKLKITDFGVSEVFSGIHPGLRAAGGECGKDMGEVRLCAPGICGSMPYIAPEVVIKKGEYDPRPLDVWSSAIVMLHVIFGGALWPRAERGHKNYDSLVRGWEKWEARHPDGGKITETDYPHVTAFDLMVNPPALRRLLVGMLHPDPAKRITIGEVAQNRWMKNVECCQVETYDDPTAIIDASKSRFASSRTRVVYHNHLPPVHHKGHSLVRLPGSTDM